MLAHGSPKLKHLNSWCDSDPHLADVFRSARVGEKCFHKTGALHIGLNADWSRWPLLALPKHLPPLKCSWLEMVLYSSRRDCFTKYNLDEAAMAGTDMNSSPSPTRLTTPAQFQQLLRDFDVFLFDCDGMQCLLRDG